ncbi:MAG: HEAT repeat domain-containing protein [Anaerolineae bacterium]|nr:HEAT repeat domain-containing protein [Anaerolineae bacterium]
MAASVFISYARKDADLGAAPLDAALRPLYAVWRDLRGIDPAQDFTAEIEKALQAASHVIVCVTPDTLRDDSFVRREIAYASYLKKPILVARFADVPPPIQVFTNTWIDFFKGWDAAFDTLCHWLSGEAVASSQTVSAPAQQPDPYKPYLEALYADVVDSIRASVFSDETITLRAVETVGDVQCKTRQLNPKYIPYTLRETPAPDPTPEAFDSLRDAYNHAHCAGRVLLLGEPGAGKTTTLLAFARDTAAARLSDPSQPLPIFARISGWDSYAQTPLHEWLAAIHSLDAAALQNLIEGGQSLLLLDGLDELGSRRPVNPDKPDGEQYDPRERFLKALSTTGKIILSSRVEEYRQIGTQASLNCAVRLERLDDAQMQMYLTEVVGLWEVICADADLKDALRTPLLLALVRVAFEDAPESVRALGGLDAGDLNDRIWDAFIDKRWQHEQKRTPDDPLPYTAAQLKHRLGLAVVRAISDGKRDDHTRIVEADIGGSDIKAVTAMAQRLDLLRSAGDEPVTRRDGNRALSWRFLHLLLRDMLTFLTATAALRDPDEDLRRSSAIALGQLGDVRAMSPLIDALRDSNARVRGSTVNSLGLLRDARVVLPLNEALRDPEASVRRSAAQMLGKLGDTRAVLPLIDSAQDHHWLVRRDAVDALGKIGDERAFPQLIESLRDQETRVCSYAARALGRLGNALAVLPLLDSLQDPRALVRSSSARALGHLGDASAAESLIDVLQDKDFSVRRSAVDALGRLRDARAVPPLMKTLRDQEASVRRSTAEALGQLSDTRAVPALIDTLRDPVRFVRHFAARALRKFPDHPAARAALADYYAGKLKPRDE